MWIWEHLDRVFFGQASESPGWRGRILRSLRYPYAITRDLLAGGEINLRAMSLVFATLLALIPALAFTFSLMKGFGPHKALQPILLEFFRPLGAQAPEITARVMQFADRLQSRVIGSVGFVLLIWTLISAMKKVEDSFNFVWRVEHARSLAHRLAESLALLIAGPVLLVGFIGLSHAGLSSETVHRVSELPIGRRLLGATLRGSPYVLAMLLFTLLYRTVPNTHVRWRPALIGGVCAGLAWAAVGKLFAVLVMASTRFTLVYTSFAVVIALPTWTYLGWLILLAGAQLSFYLQHPSYLPLGLEEIRLSSVEREKLGLKIACLAAHAWLAGTAPWTEEALAERLGVPGLILARVRHNFERAGILRTDRAQTLVLARDPGTIGVIEILDAVRLARSGPVRLPTTPIPAVERLAARLHEAWRASCGDGTLKDLARESETVMGLESAPLEGAARKRGSRPTRA